MIYDSHVIINYLRERQGLPAISVQESNLVSAIDGVTDSLIILFMAKRSGLDVTEDKLLFRLQLERIPVSLQWLEAQAASGQFNAWSVASNALVCLLDWARFRELYAFDQYPELCAVRDRFSEKPIVKQTYPVL